MLLRKIQIENFRGITNIQLGLDRTTVLIGENNTGKTTVLEALNSCMNRGLTRRSTPFSEFDFHLATENAEAKNALPLAITLVFEEVAEDEWVKEIDEAFKNAVQVLDDNRKQITFRVTAKFDKALKDFSVEWSFLNKDGDVLPTARGPNLVTNLQSLAPVFLLGAVRDASQNFQPKSSFWGPFTKNPQVDDETRIKIEEQIGSLNQAILDSHKPFDVVKERLEQTGKLLPLGTQDLVSVEAIPARISDMLAKTQVKLAGRTGARLPISQHGAGTQSLSVLFLFEAFLQSRLAEAYDKNSEPILALEEPESHLHPSAIRALWSTLDGLAGQKIIATHSGDLLAAVPIKSLRRLARKGGQIQIFQVAPNALTPEDERKISYHVRAKRGNLLFAKSWILVEGESEFWFLPEAAKLNNHDFELLGVCCVEFAQCGLDSLIKLAIALGIEWHVMTDADQAGQNYAATARQYLNGEPEAKRITLLAEQDLEHCLWNHGYDAVYTQAAQPLGVQQVQVKNCANGVPCQWTQQPQQLSVQDFTIKRAIRQKSKPHLAVAVIDAAKAPASPGLPLAIQTAINAAVTNSAL
jgi:putative ATP-dependent endonuclease of OLD family